MPRRVPSNFQCTIVWCTLRCFLCDVTAVSCAAMAVGRGECWPAAGRWDRAFVFPFPLSVKACTYFFGVGDRANGEATWINKNCDNVAVLLPIARCVSSGAVGLGCFTDMRCSAAAWRTDRPAVRVPRPTPLGLRDETAATALWSQRRLLAAVGRCEWDASPHGCCGGASPWLL
ncbi:putative retrotransposon hot spot protein (RHS,) [Trypanosoma cruzi]|uniref:Putative retrotransposon hot spot protein (RHS,) n=1 Tax=Trypanosoma cruzi TaxID=5693 RepID=A0A2V2UZU1_TRYCR|nr:putative retrotransposon hot spot protein (RHS,) [Trypanosoma cruzi]